MKESRNARVQSRWDELMRIGKHGHYETLFQIVNEEIKAAISVDKDAEAVATVAYFPPDTGCAIRVIDMGRIPVGNSDLFLHPSPPNQQVRDAYERAAQIAELALGADGSLGKIAGIPQAIRALIPSEPAIGEQVAELKVAKVKKALGLMQEMWDELHRANTVPGLMRMYSDALTELEEILFTITTEPPTQVNTTPVGEAVSLSAPVETALLYALWCHQGSSSPVGQPIRAMLGMGQFDHLTDGQVEKAITLFTAPIPTAITREPLETKIAQVIREVDGDHSLGAGQLAEKIIDAILAELNPKTAEIDDV